MTKSSPAKLAYAREYYEKHKEYIKARRRERWKNADEEARDRQRMYGREWYHRNSEQSKSKTLSWMRANKELVNARVRLSRYRKQGKTELIEREETLIAQLLAEKKTEL